MDSKELRSLMEAYQQVSAPQEVEEVENVEEGKSSRPLGVMHQFARGMKQKKGEKREKKYGMDSEGNRVGKYVHGGSRALYPEEVELDEAKKKLPYGKMFRKAGNLGRDGSPEAMERSKKITGVMNKNAARVAAHRERDDAAKNAKDARRAAEKDRQAKAKMKEEVDIDEGLRDKVGEKVKKHINKYAYKQGIHNNPGWLRKPEKRAALNKAVRDDIKKNPKAAVKYAAGEMKRKVKEKLRKEEVDVFDTILEFLIAEEIAQDIQEANWIMANAITEEQIDEILGMFTKKAEKKTEYAGRSMKKPVPDEGRGYTVDKRGPEVSVSTYGKGGKTGKFKTRGRV